MGRRWRRWQRQRRLFLWSLVLAWSLTLGLLGRSVHALPQGGYTHPEVLIQAEELKSLMATKDPYLRIIDVRHKAKYYLGHIPGAVQLWRHEIEDKRLPFPGLPAAPAQMEQLLGRLGISNHDTLILYSDQFEHARLWWLLAYLGFPLSQMKLLDGGIEAWKAKGYPTQLTSPGIKRASLKLPPAAQRKSLLATLNQVKEAFSDPSKVILDARGRRQHLGEAKEEGAARAGHIPGAVWVDWKETGIPEGPYKGYWKSAAEIKAIFAAQGATPDRDIYLYSHTGRHATYTLVSLYLVGYPLEKLHLYAGSWVEWSRSKEPIKTGGPTPVK